jgi:hypothetical protein
MSKIPIQDIRGRPTDKNEIVYHVHGKSQCFGTCKMHKNPDCPRLLSWKPEKGLGKVLMMNDYPPGTIGDKHKCKTCWKK